MIEYSTIIHKFSDQGEKTGWTYIDVPVDIAQQLKPDTKKTFRVKGYLDSFSITGIALVPMGEGNYILALNADIRKGIRKAEGAILLVKLEEDKDFTIETPIELIECLNEDPVSMDYYYSLAKSHRDYFSKWIDSAKTETTRTNRIVQTVNALAQRWDYGQMIRAGRKNKNK